MGIIDIRKLLRRLPENGTTVLVSSHQLAEVQQACDRLIILANGRLVTQGTVDEILGSSTSHVFRVSLAEMEIERGLELFTSLGHRVDLAGPTALMIAPPAQIGGDMINRFLVDAGIYASEITKPTVSLEAAFLDLVSAQPVAQDASKTQTLNQLNPQGTRS
jgi:ABC-2 type transport system ATP-binding protein